MYFFYALLLHVIMLSILIVSFEWSATNYVIDNSDKKSQVINAVMVNDSKIELPHSSTIPSSVSKKLVLHKKMVKETSAKKAIAIPKEHKKQFTKAVIQKQLLAEIKKQKLTSTIQKNKQKAFEKEFKKEFEKELKSQAAKTLQQELLKEKEQIASAQSAKMQGIVDKYKALILQAIAEHWLVPHGVDKSLSSELLIRVAKGGTVLDVQVVKSSGDEALDRSAKSAVFKSSPLPVPTDTDEFEPFREFILKVKPENVLARDS